MDSLATKTVYLVRYGTIPEVARFVAEIDTPLARNDDVVVQTHRGEQLGTVLERERFPVRGDEIEFRILRVTTADDLAHAEAARQRCDTAISKWTQRIVEWELQLELLDMEETLDGSKVILYVLCERGPDSTKLALQAAAAGLGLIEVQPVTADGLVPVESGGGCGSGGCGCSH